MNKWQRDRARKWCDRRLKKIEKRLQEIYSTAYKELKVKWDDYLAVINVEIEQLQQAKEAAEKAGDAKQAKVLAYLLSQQIRDKTINDKRFSAMTDEMLMQLYNTSNSALKYVNHELPSFFIRSYNQVGEDILDIGMKLKYGYSFELMDSGTLDVLLRNKEIMLPKKELDEAKEIAWNKKNINSQLTQGILQGESVDKIAERLKNVVGMNQAQAIRAARTMCTAAENLGRIESYKKAQKDGVILKKVWMATDDRRTRDWHRELNGQEEDVNVPFVNAVGKIMYPADPQAHPSNVYNCRCCLVTHIIGFIDIDEEGNEWRTLI